MKKILVLFAHPKYEKSTVNTALIEYIKDKVNVTIHDLYEKYHDFHIDVKAEKELLQQHDIIIWHHPFYWYSCPPLLKQWIDMVLEFNWAYGPKGKALEGKICLNTITTGASKAMYCSEGTNSFTVRQFLRPFEQTANLCNMSYFPPFAVMGTHKLTEDILEQSKIKYGEAIDLLQSNLTLNDFENISFLNDIPQLNTT
ncbi:NAD(P)H-dependent oxidoreductase [Polaribacter vadi]|uniref:NAD(P)H-dependent oxidoreductase n=1 Tax=Polaribacter TaxID=52959 RepID=UPI001C09B3F6|nr:MULTISPECIES: NAD(P)H-dependent oxidoreductase [Polaribacter]MBU3013074.1 NAD(P)H-dependent oxidoreductase [Polaribacter vadi]MDO6742892.1 NAD(P)H-dependent oxidoreductase [Polaribacter sp. 1_MG-2023]